MKSIKLLFTFSIALFFLGCNVEGIDEVNSVTADEKKIDPAASYDDYDAKECETAYAYSGSNEDCFAALGFKKWGWRIGPLSDPTNETYDIYAAAGKCDLSKGYMVGTLSVSYENGVLNVEFDALPGYGFFETHLYAGNAEFPTLPNGKPTVAPGQYGNTNSYESGSSSDSYTIEGLSGDIYLIAHAVVCEFEEPCDVDPGALKAPPKTCLEDGMATLIADHTEQPVVPEGYEVLYVLTQGPELVIIDVNSEPTFMVDNTGDYTIHTLVFDPDTLDLSIVELGVTTGFDVFGLLIDGGGDICAALDVTGAPITVEKCDEEECTAFAGNLKSEGTDVCLIGGVAQLVAIPEGDAIVPDGYEVLYVLTQGDDLVIVNVNADPVFEVNSDGIYTIHTLVYDPGTLDLSGVEIGVTTGGDVYSLLIEGGGDICGSLDVAGAQFKVIICQG